MNYSLGRMGEDVATQYLLKSGFKILERNFRTPFGEIDIIAKKLNKLYFIEVKTRSSVEFGRGAEAVRREKLSHIRKSAEFYLGDSNVDYEIAILDILKVGDKFEIEFIRDIL